MGREIPLTMHDPVLDEALKRLAAEASTRFTSLVATGDEIPFDVAENNGDSSHFYRYVPLTSRFISTHLEELKSLPSYGPARGAIASSDVAAPYLESRGLPVPSEPTRRAEEMIAVFITSLWEGTTEFSLDISRVEAALAGLEVQTRDIREADVLIVPLVGFEMTPTEVTLEGGIRIAQADSIDAPLEATSSEGTGRSAWQTAYFAMTELESTEDGPRQAVNRLNGMIRALRLYKEGSVGLGPFAFAPVGESSWRRIETAVSPPRPGSYFLIESEVDSLNELIRHLAKESPAADRMEFAQKRFQYGCERENPVEALSDHLLAIRASLGGEGVIDAPLAARAAALITGNADDLRSRERIELALDLEQSLVNGEDLMSIGGESATYIAAWVEDSTRHILREAVLGHYGMNLNIAAEETLITSGLTAGEGSARDYGSSAEWDPVEEPAEDRTTEPVAEEGADIHIFKPRVVGGTSVDGPVDDPLFGIVPEFQAEPLPEAPLQPMPEIERALGIESSVEPSGEPEFVVSSRGNGKGLFDQGTGDEDSGTTRLLEPIPEAGEISVTASTEIGATLREDWLSQAHSNGSTMEWPSHAMDGLDEARHNPHPKPNRNFFPDPGTTEWSISEMRFKNR
ncbi:MAG TPA: hypothetical protein PKA65_12465 [Solirubrobacterales bacterium]|nr:hypothetical protein [Solirubrobacterales bacterium]